MFGPLRNVGVNSYTIYTLVYITCHCFLFQYPRQALKFQTAKHNMHKIKAALHNKELEQLKLTENTHFTFLPCFLTESAAGGGGGGEEGKSKTCVVL